MNLIVHVLTGATLGAAISAGHATQSTMMWLGAISDALPDLDHVIKRIRSRSDASTASPQPANALLHSLVTMPLAAFFGMIIVQGFAPLLDIGVDGALPTAALIASAVGAHIALDLVSEKGVMLLHPYSKRHWSTGTHSPLDPVILGLLLSGFFGVLPLTVLASLFAYVSAMLAWREMLYLRAQHSIRIAGWPGAEITVTPETCSPFFWKVTARIKDTLVMTSRISMPGRYPLIWRPVTQNPTPWQKKMLPVVSGYQPFTREPVDAEADKSTVPCQNGAGMRG